MSTWFFYLYVLPALVYAALVLRVLLNTTAYKQKDARSKLRRTAVLVFVPVWNLLIVVIFTASYLAGVVLGGYRMLRKPK